MNVSRAIERVVQDITKETDYKVIDKFAGVVEEALTEEGIYYRSDDFVTAGMYGNIVRVARKVLKDYVK